ncbi:prolyl 3-hydroxylase 2 [Tachysurus ichikawai]
MGNFLYVQSAFTAAVQLYDNGDFEESVTLFEKALAEYYKSDAECRVLCEGPQSFRDHDHVLYRYTLSELISDHYTQVLNCKHECVRDLATRPGRLSPMENYLPLHYDYLQFAYFQGNVTSSVGDGYRGKVSPHTPNEKFEGTTVLKTLQYGYEGRVPLRSARLFYDISEKARTIIESYFMLNSTLHFSYTHLVCRTAVPDQQEHRNDLSHPIHADNCLLDPEARECWKEPPAYTYRDYSALLYLNGDFEGGQFIFTKMDAKTITASVKPRCGRMVGFSSGGENPHGVRAVTRGQRCAVAIWFTLDPLYRELERLQADEVIQALENQHQWDHDHINQKDEL